MHPFKPLALVITVGLLFGPGGAHAKPAPKPEPIPAKGTLLIGGGALARDNLAIWQSLADRLKAPGSTVAVIASASGAPQDALKSLQRNLGQVGIAPERVVLVETAVVDDPDTPNVDEASWRRGAWSEAEVAKVRSAAVIWFTGGDQVRTLEALSFGNNPSPLLQAVRQRLTEGAVVGGSSAGAAIQSQPMIVRGHGLTVLTDPVRLFTPAAPDNGGLMMAPGAGFFPFGIVDQHFDYQARLGRLFRALESRRMSHDPRPGFGIDENTVLKVDFATRTAEVVGEGSVTVMSLKPLPVSGLTEPQRGQAYLSLLAHGDRLDLTTLKVTPAADSQPVRVRVDPDETPEEPVLGLGGPSALVDQLGRTLLNPDVRGPVVLRQWRTDGLEARYSLSKTAETRAWVGRTASAARRHGVSGLELTLELGQSGPLVPRP